MRWLERCNGVQGSGVSRSILISFIDAVGDKPIWQMRCRIPKETEAPSLNRNSTAKGEKLRWVPQIRPRCGDLPRRNFSCLQSEI